MVWKTINLRIMAAAQPIVFFWKVQMSTFALGHKCDTVFSFWILMFIKTGNETGENKANWIAHNNCHSNAATLVFALLQHSIISNTPHNSNTSVTQLHSFAIASYCPGIITSYMRFFALSTVLYSRCSLCFTAVYMNQLLKQKSNDLLCFRFTYRHSPSFL